MLYTIAALLLAAAVGSTLLRLLRQETASSGDFGDIARAQICVEAGVLSVEGDMKDNPAAVVSAINRYINPNYTAADKGWLVGGPDSWQFLSNRQKFNARITGFDTAAMVVQIEVTGVAVGAGRRSAQCIYEIDNVGFPASGSIATHALYLGRQLGAVNLHERINVDGATFIGSPFFFDKHVSGSTFNGEFRTLTDTTATSRLQGNYTFKGPTYFGTKTLWDDNGSVHFASDVAFEGTIDGGGASVNFIMQKNMYFYDKVVRGWTTDFNLSGNMLIHDGSPNLADGSGASGDWTNYTAVNNHGQVDLLSAVGMSQVDPKEVRIDSVMINAIPQSVIDKVTGVNNQWTGAMLNARYNTQSAAGKLWNDFYVVEVAYNATLNLDDISPREAFAHKLLLIIRGKVFVGSTGLGMYNSTNDAVSIFYVAGGGVVENLGGWDGDFRGYFFCDVGGRLCLGGSTNNSKIKGNLKGAVTVYDGAASFDFYPLAGNSPHVTFDGDVMAVVAATGLLKSPTGVVGAQADTLVLGAGGLNERMLALRY